MDSVDGARTSCFARSARFLFESSSTFLQDGFSLPGHLEPNRESRSGEQWRVETASARAFQLHTVYAVDALLSAAFCWPPPHTANIKTILRSLHFCFEALSALSPFSHSSVAHSDSGKGSLPACLGVLGASSSPRCHRPAGRHGSLIRIIRTSARERSEHLKCAS